MCVFWLECDSTILQLFQVFIHVLIYVCILIFCGEDSLICSFASSPNLLWCFIYCNEIFKIVQIKNWWIMFLIVSFYSDTFIQPKIYQYFTFWPSSSQIFLIDKHFQKKCSSHNSRGIIKRDSKQEINERYFSIWNAIIAHGQCYVSGNCTSMINLWSIMEL